MIIINIINTKTVITTLLSHPIKYSISLSLLFKLNLLQNSITKFNQNSFHQKLQEFVNLVKQFDQFNSNGKSFVSFFCLLSEMNTCYNQCCYNYLLLY